MRRRRWLGQIFIRASVLSTAIIFATKFGHRGLTMLAKAVISLPAAMVGIGAGLVYKGIQMISAHWAASAFEKIANGIVLTAVGYYILENYKHFKVYSFEQNDKNYPQTGRGILEDFLSSQGGNWTWID